MYGSSNFPGLSKQNSKVTSPRARGYNCIAWSVGDNRRWWWPNPLAGGFWPEGVPLATTVESFSAAFRTEGFEACEDGQFEAEYEKIVLYVNQAGVPTHAARQLDSKWWSSKLGQNIDIMHLLDALDGPSYGQPRHYFRRPQRS